GADPGALHAFDTRKEPGPAAEDYSRELERAVPKNGGDVPVLDLVLLGLGTDTHTASWFPGSDFPEDR
ncbi:MAG: 6-phosphogluconolactonase, partial [Acidobacteria bacterium]|nr:6-phosphogluconolactonase [Acidobacteriota bacterium]NIQ85446.1 6-phosphogluconolactonase [Acidobacteriota bacterium]